jgi:hypothetical protein
MAKKSKKISGENVPSGNLFFYRLKTACEGLFYMSETDAPVEPFFASKTDTDAKETILNATGNTESADIEEGNFDQFFARLWYNYDEKKVAARPVSLRQLLEENLVDFKVFRIGRIGIGVYVVGRDRDGNLAGVKTKAVET